MDEKVKSKEKLVRLYWCIDLSDGGPRPQPPTTYVALPSFNKHCPYIHNHAT